MLVAAGLTRARGERESTLGALIKVILALRLLMFRRGVRAVPEMLREQGLDLAPIGSPSFEPLLDVASDGRPLASLLEFAQQADSATFDRIVTTQLQDAGRTGESLATAVRPQVTGYVRMLQMPSCSRCIVLAGRVYRWSDGFDRHPQCDCIHVPTSEDVAEDLTTNPNRAFDSLPSAAELGERYPGLTVEQRRKRGLYSQEDIFTAAGAQALRDGADMGRVVNARTLSNRRGTRSSVYSAQAFGRDVLATYTYQGAMRRLRNGDRPPVRLMPESIYELAEGDRAEALRLLRLYGYIT